jgi:alpha-mannosidase
MKTIFASLCLLFAGCAAWAQPVTVYAVPNTHGTVSGWLVDFGVERNYVLNNYLAHLDKVKADEDYRFAYSEVPNLISFLQFAPGRLDELKQRIREKRVELSNGFFLEPTVSLSGGEALVRMGVLGLRWYDEVFGFRPRHCWMIDTTGVHRQMPQIVSGLGMETLIFCRNNPAKDTAFWWVAPDGTRALTIPNPLGYADLGKIFDTKEPLGDEDFAVLAKHIERNRELSAGRNILLALSGHGDYSSPPARDDYPSAFLREWSKRYPGVRIRFSIPGDYVDALKDQLQAGAKLLEYSGDTGYSWDAFWINMPEVKRCYRRDEHLLQAAEMAATIASARGRVSYPSQDFYYSWINMLMNMDRNTLWGAAAGMVFRDPDHWDAWDRFTAVEKQSLEAIAGSVRAMTGRGSRVAFFNPCNWKRSDPIELDRLNGKAPAGMKCESVLGTSRLACIADLPSSGVVSFGLSPREIPAPVEADLPGAIETEHYIARIDPKSGALASLKAKPSGTELLGGPANVVVVEELDEKRRQNQFHFLPARPERRIVASSAEHPVKIQVLRGPLSTRVHATSEFHRGGSLERRMVFYNGHPRIDFETTVNLRGTDILLTVDFPLGGEVTGRTRGIPYGHSAADPRKEKIGSILPAIRWSNYQLGDAGLALLDRGLAGHELNERTLTLGLLNATSTYMGKPNEMLRGEGERVFQYALVPHDGSWRRVNAPRLAYEYKSPVLMVPNAGTVKPVSFVETSDNVIVEAVRRAGKQIEVRLYETRGEAGTAEISLHLPHRAAALANLMGEKPEPLRGGPAYRFPIRPQQIVTLRFDTDTAVSEPPALRDWKPLVPLAKRKSLEMRIPDRGHPPR